MTDRLIASTRCYSALSLSLSLSLPFAHAVTLGIRSEGKGSSKCTDAGNNAILATRNFLINRRYSVLSFTQDAYLRVLELRFSHGISFKSSTSELNLAENLNTLAEI